MEKTNENFWHYEQKPKGEKSCPTCGKSMKAEFSSMVMTSNPPQQRWYWECACGYLELGGIHVREPVKMNVAI